jgi:hypothetical protein
MKSLLSLLAIVSLGLGVAACGGAGTSTGSASHLSSNTTTARSAAASTAPGTTPATRYHYATNDDDSDDSSTYEIDDKNILEFGHEATQADKIAITTVVSHYFEAAVAGDGRTACPLIYSVVLAAIPEDYGTSPPGPPYLRGKTCAVVMSKLFKHNHRQLAGEIATFEVVDVRVHGSSGLALLSWAEPLRHFITVHREHHAWKLEALLDNELR